MAQITLLNQTTTEKSYISGKVTLPASGNVSLDLGYAPFLAIDPNFISDLQLTNTYISDSVNTYIGPLAQDYINNWITNGPPYNSQELLVFSLFGVTFSVNTSISLSNTTQTAALLITNPSSATVNIRLNNFYIVTSGTQGISTVTAYINPTISSNGTVLSILNTTIGNANSSSSLAYSAPTASSMGTALFTTVFNAAGPTNGILDLKQSIIITPGNSLLFTVTMSDLGLLTSVTNYLFCQWVEV